MENLEVIGRYKPTTTDPQKMMRHLAKMTRDAGFVPKRYMSPYSGATVYDQKITAEVRDPNWHNTIGNNDSSDNWHQDGGGDFWIAGWATQFPTEFRAIGGDYYRGHGDVWIPEPFQVVAWDNSEWEHRSGVHVLHRFDRHCKRYFFRQYLNPKGGEDNE